VKDAVLTLASLAILVLAGLSIFAPPRMSFAMDVSTQAISGDSAVIYGTVVDASDRPVRGATVAIVREANGDSTQVAALTTAPDGTFRTVLSGPFGEHRVLVSADMGGRVVRDSQCFLVEGGHAYGVRAELINRDYFVFLPISTY
jgi:hypothetical protein